ncbi:MAG: AraC family transcriptional regulator [Phycisphaerae bacterium]|jgi:AraC-like DNA-binding protein
MGIGGYIKPADKASGARLQYAYTGITEFSTTGWASLRTRQWVLDCINHGQQAQRIGSGRKYMRPSNLVVLYPPLLEFHEYRQVGRRLDEAFLIFDLSGATERAFRNLLSPLGYCHIQDPEHLITDRMGRLGKLVSEGRPSYGWFSQALFFEIIGLVLQSTPCLLHTRTLCPGRKAVDLCEMVEAFILAHIAEPISIAHLAKHLRMSESAFAHTYAKVSGASPHQTVLRLKINAAKTLLLQKNLGLKVIAEQLGFSSPFHLSSVFKRVEGLSPSAFQRAMTK